MKWIQTNERSASIYSCRFKNSENFYTVIEDIGISSNQAKMLKSLDLSPSVTSNSRGFSVFI